MQIRAGQHGLFEARGIEAGLGETRADQCRSIEFGDGQIGGGKIRAGEILADAIETAQIGARASGGGLGAAIGRQSRRAKQGGRAR